MPEPDFDQIVHVPYMRGMPPHWYRRDDPDRKFFYVTFVTKGSSPTMPEPPDFDQIARSVLGHLYTPGWPNLEASRLVLDVVEQLRQVWNARGAADAQAVHARMVDMMDGDLGTILGAGIAQHLDQILHALDR